MADIFTQNPYQTTSPSVAAPPTSPLYTGYTVPVASNPSITPAGTSTSPAVVSSSAAVDKANAIQGVASDLTQGVMSQTAKNAQDKAAKDAQAKLDAEKATATQTAQSQLKADQDLLTQAKGLGYTNQNLQYDASGKLIAPTSSGKTNNLPVAPVGGIISGSSANAQGQSTGYDTQGNLWTDTGTGGKQNWTLTQFNAPTGSTAENPAPVNAPQGIDTTTQVGQIQWYNQDPQAFEQWANSQGWKDTDLITLQKAAAAEKLNQTGDDITKTMTQFLNGTYPLTPDQQAQYNALQQQWTLTIQAQQTANETYLAGAGMAAARSGGEYNPVGALGKMKAATQEGLSQVAQIEAKQNAALAALKQSFEDNNFKMVTASYGAIQKAQEDKLNIISDLLKTATDTANKIKDDLFTQVTKPIQDISLSAAKNGADQKTIDAINNSKSVTDAIAAAGDSLQTATGVLGDYLEYKKETEAKGLVPMDYGAYQDQQNKKEIQLKSAEAYATEAGKNAADAASGVNPDGTPISPADPDNQSILAQTGLSVPAFNFLTQGTSALTRMTAGQRQKYMDEAQNFLNSKGIDISTFQSQYKALNQVVDDNTQRAFNMSVRGKELSGTIDQFVNDLGSKLGGLRGVNMADIALGKEVNNPTAQKYSADLHTMINDLAGYFASSVGNSSPDDSDKITAAQVIQNGINTGSAQALKDYIDTNVSKTTKVVNDTVDQARSGIWNLFGVGDKFKPPVSDTQATSAINDYVKENPILAGQVTKLYVPGATDADILQYMQMHPEVYGLIPQ